MANKDLFKQAIAEAKSVREAAIANAKEALEESLTPHLKDMLAAKLQEMEDSSTEEEVVNEVEEEVEEAHHKDDKDEAHAKDDTDEGLVEVDEAEDDAEETADDAEDITDDEIDAEAHDDEAHEEEVDGDADLSDLSVDQFKDMIRDIISQEVGAGQAGDDLGAELDAGDIEGLGDEPDTEIDAMDDLEGDADEIDLDELLRELDTLSSEDIDEAPKKDKEEDKMEEVTEETAVEVPAESDTKAKNVNHTLKEALDTIETLKSELNEVNILNAKLLYVNKIFKANDLSESQKVNVIAAFDKAETVKEVKLVFETVSENVIVKRKKASIKESFGSASKTTGSTKQSTEVINEVSDAVRRMQKLAGII